MIRARRVLAGTRSDELHRHAVQQVNRYGTEVAEAGWSTILTPQHFNRKPILLLLPLTSPPGPLPQCTCSILKVPSSAQFLRLNVLAAPFRNHSNFPHFISTSALTS